MAKFSSSQSELFTVCALVYGSILEFLASFTGFKPKYTAAFVAARQASLATAEAMPDEDARAAVHRLLRLKVEKAAEKARHNYQSLKRYIEDAFAPEEWDILFDEAGQNYYAKASENDWEAVKSMLTNAKNFVANHSAELLAGDVMPPTFPASLDAVVTSFNNTLLLFHSAQENAKVGTANKGKACETEYDEIIQICKDGQLMYTDDPSVSDQFTFTTVLDLVRGAGIAGLRGYATSLATSLPITGVLVEILTTDKQAFTDIKGRYEIKQVAAGTYTIRFSAAGYETITIQKEIIVGTISSLSVQMIPSI